MRGDFTAAPTREEPVRKIPQAAEVGVRGTRIVLLEEIIDFRFHVLRRLNDIKWGSPAPITLKLRPKANPILPQPYGDIEVNTSDQPALQYVPVQVWGERRGRSEMGEDEGGRGEEDLWVF